MRHRGISIGDGGAGLFSAAARPISRTLACVGEREDHDLFALDLIRDSEGKAIQYGDSAVRPSAPPRCGFGKLEDRLKHHIDLVFELGSEPNTARLVVVDLVIDLRDCEPVDAKLQRRARATLR